MVHTESKMPNTDHVIANDLAAAAFVTALAMKKRNVIVELATIVPTNGPCDKRSNAGPMSIGMFTVFDLPTLVAGVLPSESVSVSFFNNLVSSGGCLFESALIRSKLACE